MIISIAKVSRIEITNLPPTGQVPAYTEVILITETGEVYNIMAQSATNGTEVVVK